MKKCTVTTMLMSLAASASMFSSWATNGIAVSAHWTNECELYAENGNIMRYDIIDDVVVHSRVIHEGCARFATFNKQGSRIAFFKGLSCNKGSCPEWALMTMAIDGTDLDTIMKTPSMGKARMSWTTDNWIYYFVDKTLHRVKADNPSRNEQVVTFNDNTGWWGMDAFGKRMSMGVGRQHVRYVLPGNGQLTEATTSTDYVGYGCNNLISPSGSLFTWTVDAGHAGLLYRTWDSMNLPKWDGIVTWQEYNSWSTDKSMQMNCWEPGRAVTVGVGFEGNRWSANSDQWVCMGLGWPDGGRFSKCGKNQVLVNWHAKKTIMVSKNPRSTCRTDPAVCDFHSTEPQQSNEAGDFWVSGPISEIVPELRPGANESRNSQAGPTPKVNGRSIERSFFDIHGKAAKSGVKSRHNSKVVLIEKSKNCGGTFYRIILQRP